MKNAGAHQSTALRALEDALRRIPTCRVSLLMHFGEGLRVFFSVAESPWLYVVGRAIDRNYGGYGFRVELVSTDIPADAVGHCLTMIDAGDSDLRASTADPFTAALALALRLHYILDNEHVLRHFGLDPTRVSPRVPATGVNLDALCRSG